MDDETRALAAQVAALTVLLQAFTATQAAPATFTGTLDALDELWAASWPRGVTWRASKRATLKPGAKHFAARAAVTLTRADWLNFRDNVRAEQTTLMKGKPEATTLNREMAVRGEAYRWAIAEGHLRENPVKGIKPIKAKKHRQTETTDDDVAKLRPFLDDEGWAYALLGQRRGLRAVEARKLEWPDVDLAHGRISFFAAKTHVWTTMRIPSDIVEALRAIRPDVARGYVFPSPTRPRQPLDQTTLWRKFRDAADKAGLQAAPGDRRVRFHDTRHGFTSARARELPIQVAMRMSRHAGYRSAQRYIHVNEDDLEVAYEKLEKRRPARAASRAVDDDPNVMTKR